MRRRLIGLAAAGLLLVAACGGDDDDGNGDGDGRSEATDADDGVDEGGGDASSDAPAEGSDAGGQDAGGEPSYGPEVEARFMDGCTTSPSFDDTTCQCVWDEISANVPYDEYAAVEDLMWGDAGDAEPPDWVLDAVSACGFG